MRHTVPVTIVLSLLTVHCQKTIPDSERFETASLQLQSGEYQEALAGLQQLAGDPDADPVLRFRAARDSIECIAYAHGQEQAKESFAGLWAEHRDSLGVQDLAAIGGRLAAAHCPWAALEVIKVADGIVADAGDKEKLARLAQHVRNEANSPEMDSALAALGYL